MTGTRSEKQPRQQARRAQGRLRRVPVVPLAAAALGVLVVAYLGVTWWSQTQSSVPVAQVAPAAAGERGEFRPPLSPPAPGDAAPDFTVATLDHGPFTLSAQRGKPAVVFFTAYT